MAAATRHVKPPTTQLLGQPCHPALPFAHLPQPRVRPPACAPAILLLSACSPASSIRLLCRPVSSIWRPRPCTVLLDRPAATRAGLRSPSPPLVRGDIPPRPSVRGGDRRGRRPPPRRSSETTYPRGRPCGVTITAAAPRPRSRPRRRPPLPLPVAPPEAQYPRCRGRGPAVRCIRITSLPYY